MSDEVIQESLDRKLDAISKSRKVNLRRLSPAEACVLWERHGRRFELKSGSKQDLGTWFMRGKVQMSACVRDTGVIVVYRF